MGKRRRLGFPPVTQRWFEGRVVQATPRARGVDASRSARKLAQRAVVSITREDGDATALPLLLNRVQSRTDVHRFAVRRDRDVGDPVELPGSSASREPVADATCFTGCPRERAGVRIAHEDRDPGGPSAHKGDIQKTVRPGTGRPAARHGSPEPARIRFRGLQRARDSQRSRRVAAKHRCRHREQRPRCSLPRPRTRGGRPG